ncbi:adenylosuccinate lyase [Candidatus Woesearchaeota archaeon]|nr:adenylosuccinate lyase [Candidatus Woesearchaeota archaeon]
MVNTNVLSRRYATEPINVIFSEQGTIIAERDLWIAVMKAQRELGVDISAETIAKFEAAKHSIDLARILEIEKKTRHDVKARIQAFVEAAQAPEQIHLGMTSRDATDNVEQMQNKRAGKFILGKYVSVLRHLVDKSEQYAPIFLTARTHHQAAQLTSLGRRMSMWAEELYTHMHSFEHFLQGYPLRGIKGPVGTQFDMLTLLGSKEKVQKLEQRVAEQLGFTTVLDAPGQVYPRSLDYALVSHLAALGSAPQNFAIGMRLMAGYELVTEGFQEGQVGSTAMPHKMNTPGSERIWSLGELLKMYGDGASRLSGAQWEEGDVSCSALRRVVLPDAFYTSDGLCETTLTVLNKMGAYPRVIQKEIEHYLSFLATTEILTMAVKAGIGREQAHAVIKQHAVAEALAMREEGKEPALAARLATDPLFQANNITQASIEQLLQDTTHFIGNARDQIDRVRTKAHKHFFEPYAAEARYEPGKIL